MYICISTFANLCMHMKKGRRSRRRSKASRTEQGPSYTRYAIVIALDLHALKEGIHGTGSQFKARILQFRAHILHCSYILPYSTVIQVQSYTLHTTTLGYPMPCSLLFLPHIFALFHSPSVLAGMFFHSVKERFQGGGVRRKR